ncbi:MAG: polysaccharide deacetylase family protein [Candidatus Cyclobacteriaceae bacterium M3_2C_046]
MHYTLLFFILIFINTGCTSQPSAATEIDPDNNKVEIVSFVYHRFGDSRYPSTNISVKDFEQQVKFLLANGYLIKSMGEALNLLEKGVSDHKIAVLTIDDGYQSVLTGALPVLKKFDVPATLFINTKQVGMPDYLTWSQLKDLQLHKIELGNHSHSHAYFLNLADSIRQETFRQDTRQAQKLFKRHLSFEPDLYAFPFGEFEANMQQILKEEGFRAGLAQNSGIISATTDRYALPRFPMGGPFVNFERFKDKARMKAMKVVFTDKPVHILDKNPPQIELLVKTPDLNFDQFQCFIQGEKKCSMEIQTGDSVLIKIVPTQTFHQRRTLLTLTAPSNDGKDWHWFSYLWVQPELSE